MKMNKKMLGLLLSGMLMVGMVGCSSSEESENNSNSSVSQEMCISCGNEIKGDPWYTENGTECEECANSHECPNCSQQMEELHEDNWYCVNPECMSYQDPNELNQ